MLVAARQLLADGPRYLADFFDLPLVLAGLVWLAWGWRPLLRKENDGKAAQQALAIAVKREVLQEYADLLSACGLTASFTLGALARAALAPQPGGTFAMLEMGREQSELITFEKGEPVALRVVPIGGQEIAKALESRLGLSSAEIEKLRSSGPGQVWRYSTTCLSRT